MAWRAPPVLGLLSLCAACLTPTEIKVVVVSRDLACQTGDLRFGDLDVLARPTGQGLTSGSADGTSAKCDQASDHASLGSIVLTPNDPSGRAELLVVAGVSLPGTVPPTASKADDCLEQYRQFLAAGAPSDFCKDPAHACGACIVARRGLGFVEHTKLELEVDLTAECTGVFCQAGQTCGKDGRCVSAETKCQGSTCTFGDGGGGGAGGAGTTASVASASSGTTGGAGVGGQGGAGGGGCTDPGAGNVLSFATAASLNGAVDVATDGAGRAWIVTPQEIYRCVVGTCTPVAAWPVSGQPFTRISASGQHVAASTTGSVVYANDAATFIAQGTTACGAPAFAPTDTSVDGAVIDYAGVGPLGAAAVALSDPTCAKIVSGSPAGASPRLWTFAGGQTWLSGDAVLFRGSASAQSGSISVPGGVLDLWGHLDAAQVETVFTCGQSGVARVVPGQNGVGLVSHVVTSHPCLSITGHVRCDGSADVWALTGAAIEGYHIGPNTPLPMQAQATGDLAALTSTAKAVAADADRLWLATGANPYWSQRPLLP